LNIRHRHVRILTLVVALAAAPLIAPVEAQAQQRPAAQPQGGATSTPLGALGANSKDPIKIDADRLDVRDKENLAIFSGNVVAVQGKTTIRCSRMLITYEGRNQPGQPAAPRAQPAANAGGDGGGIKRLDCEGPVTVTSEDQVATGSKAVFDRERDLVIMTGNVALAKGPNITRGERLTYNTRTGIANIETNPGGRVQGFFVPGSTDQPGQPKPGQQQPAPRRGNAGPPTN
jgi:lipopolysaccharide export system protein LptA